MGIHDVVKVIASQVLRFKVLVGALKNISETDIDPSLVRGYICELSLEEVEDSFVVPKSTLEEKTLRKATKPVLVKFVLVSACSFPEGLHLISSGGFATSGEAGKDGGIDGTTRNTAHGLVSNLISAEVRGESAKDTSLIS